MGPPVVDPPRPDARPEPAPAPPFKSDRPAKEVFPGYYLRKPEKFTVYVSKHAYDKSDEEGGALAIVDKELARRGGSSRIGSEGSQGDPRLCRVGRTAQGAPRVGGLLQRHGRTQHRAGQRAGPRTFGGVWVCSLKQIHETRTKGSRHTFMLHEFGHLVHHKILRYDDPTVKATYEQAVQRKLYANVDRDDGTKGEAYAIMSDREYFAELTCAYLGWLWYCPHDAKELKELDPVGYKLMTKVYGTPEQVAAEKKKDAEKKKKDQDKKK